MSIPHSVFSAVLVFVALATTTLASTEACLPTNKREDGMNINFYEYTIGDKTTYLEPEYMGYEYSDTKKLGSVSGQTDLSIYYSPPCESTPTCETYAVMKRDEDGYDPCGPLYETKKRDTEYCDPNTAYWSSDLFGFYTTPTNVTVEMTGYFLAPENGSYTFSFYTVDDSAILSIGGDNAFACCEQQQSSVTSTNFTIDAVGGNDGSSSEGSVYLYAGYYYPMKIVFSNAEESATLPVAVSLPNGTSVMDDFSGYVYSFENNPAQDDCTITNPASHTIDALARTRTHAWTGTYTTTVVQTSTYTGLNGLTTEETVFEIQTPTATSSSMITNTYSSASTPTAANITTSTSTSSEIVTSSSISASTSSEIVTSSSTSTSASSEMATSSSTSTLTSSYSTSSSQNEVISSSTSSSNLTTSSSISSSIPTSSAITSSSQSEETSASTTSIDSTSSSDIASSTQSVSITSTFTSDLTTSTSASSTVPTSSFITSSSESGETSASTTSINSTSSSIISSSTESVSVTSTVSFKQTSSSSSTYSTEKEVTSSLISSTSTSAITSSSAQSLTTSSFSSFLHSITPIYPSNETVVTSSSFSTTSGSSNPVITSTSSNRGSSTLDADARTASTSSGELSSSFSTTTGIDSIQSLIASTSSSVSASTTLDDSTSSASASRTYLTISSSSGSLNMPNASSSSTISSRHQETELSSTRSFTSSGSIKFSESSGSSAISSTASSTEVFSSQTSIISSSDSNSKNYEFSSTPASSRSFKASSSLSISPSTTSSTTSSTFRNQTETISFTTEIKSSMNESFTSISQSQTIDDKITSTASHTSTTVPSLAPVATEKREQTTFVTITSCGSNICSKTVSPALISTSTTTVKGVATEYTTWCPISSSKSTRQTTLVTVTSCESGICSETASPAIISTATTTINDAVTVYTTWCSLTANDKGDTVEMNTSVGSTPAILEGSQTETVTKTNEKYSISESETHLPTATQNIIHSNGASSAPDTSKVEAIASTYLTTISQQPRNTYTNSVLTSATASVEISSYIGVANNLLANSAISIFIASLLLAIV
ncbi:CBK_G0016800.mRNA.1.CDS.1 [Saccharomyces cerevisiae]|nr:Y55_G0049680.mRNA.1.CDS.1 [Saccharomyces cerevisiae]CAI4452735.1 CBK_G0016800.mRNA.1.CDS.1 [Saccharomyces cerevisiae]CAI5268372.1 CBM_HP2_G0013310.mRNA.1.CDS.1 [Saccharomyces cerevisiae]CAI6496665.1 CBM_HP2_G0013310.mRNA.1.CDS.1 [Saccharomyces cerevisiae]CAI7275815.1 CBK_G0016800.mRNA.1.CDS.1 [Saccharomyces cerevisiae]